MRASQTLTSAYICGCGRPRQPCSLGALGTPPYVSFPRQPRSTARLVGARVLHEPHVHAWYLPCVQGWGGHVRAELCRAAAALPVAEDSRARLPNAGEHVSRSLVTKRPEHVSQEDTQVRQQLPHNYARILNAHNARARETPTTSRVMSGSYACSEGTTASAVVSASGVPCCRGPAAHEGVHMRGRRRTPALAHRITKHHETHSPEGASVGRVHRLRKVQQGPPPRTTQDRDLLAQPVIPCGGQIRCVHSVADTSPEQAASDWRD